MKCILGCATHSDIIVFLPSVFADFQYSRVQPIVTPRFPLSCSETLLCELGNLAKACDLHIQVGIFLRFVLCLDFSVL